MYYVVTLLTDAKGFSILHAGSVLSAFYICLFVGRLTCSWATLRASLTKIIIVLLLLQFAGLMVAWQGKGWVSALGVAVAGLGCSGLFPCLLALTGTLFFELAGTSMGALTSAGYVGGMFMVWASGYFSQKFGLNYGFLPIILGSLICCSFFIYKSRVLLSEEQKK
jgi:fucose permease